MNINLIYQGNNYNFDLRKDINIKYIKDLASKLISKDISTFDLSYKNNLLSNYEDTTFIRDLTKDDINNNISIIITNKDKASSLSNDKIKKIKVKKDSDTSKHSLSINNIKKLLNSPLISPINSKKKISFNNYKQKKVDKKSMEYITENKVFEEVYNSKENEIFYLMKTLSQKIKEYDDILYKKYKNNSKVNNNGELPIYEKYIIDFKNRQISFLKKLINYFEVNEKDFLSGIIYLTDFYKELKQYNNQKNVFIYNNTDYNKTNGINTKSNNILNNNLNNLQKAKSKIKIGESNFIRNHIVDKKLPLLSNNKIKNRQYFLSLDNNNTIHSDEDKENDNNLKEEKKKFKDIKYNSDNKKLKNKTIIKEQKSEVLNKTENKEIITNNNNIFEENIKNSNNKKNNYNKVTSLNNTNDNTNTSQNTTSQRKISINNINKNNNIKNILKNNILNSNNSTRRMSTIIKSKKDLNNNHKINKINILLEESEKKMDIISDNSNDSELSDKRKFSISKIGDEKNYNFIRTKQSKKEKARKKMRNNIFDFLI